MIYKEENTLMQSKNIFCFNNDEENNKLINKSPKDDKEFFNNDLYHTFQTPQERLRYFVLYELQDKKNINNLREVLLNDLNEVMIIDYYVVIKTLQMLFKYEAQFIPLDIKIFSILLECFKIEKVSFEAEQLTKMYFGKFGPIFSYSSILELIDFSIHNENCRTIIWSFLLKIIVAYNYSLPLKYLSKIILLFGDLKANDKFLIPQIILGMLLSRKNENQDVIKKLFTQNSEIIKSILVNCAEGENISIISTILYLIKFYDNYDYFKEIIDICEENKEKQALEVYIFNDGDD